MDYTQCPTCATPIKDGTFTSNKIIHESATKVINQLLAQNGVAYCSRCFTKLLPDARAAYHQQINELTTLVEKHLPYIPIVTVHTPHEWKYNVITIVTAQAVTGEGALTEFLSSWNDFMGTQSNRMNQKVKSGEDSCKAKLRMATLEVGGNAIIGTDVDYAEIGAPKGLLMICMAGTAINLSNLEIINEDRQRIVFELETNFKKLNDLKKYSNIFGT